MSHVRWLVLVLVSLLLLSGPAGAAAVDQGPPVDPVEAGNDLAQLGSDIKRKKITNEDLLQYLGVAFKAYHNFAKPEKPADLEPLAADASEEDKAEWPEKKAAHDAAMKQYNAAVGRVAKLQEGHAKKAEKLFFKALTLKKISRAETNIRDDVCIRAAKIIGDLSQIPVIANDPKKRKKLTDKLTKALEGLRKAKYQVSTDHLDMTFGAIGRLNHESGLKWMLDNFVHTKNAPNEVDRLVSAHKSMVLFTEVPGKLRYAICDKFITQYQSTENSAAQSSTDPKVQATKAFWDKIRVDAIKVLQHFAQEPTDGDGQALSTVGDFKAWFRDHKKSSKPPWVDEKIKK